MTERALQKSLVFMLLYWELLCSVLADVDRAGGWCQEFPISAAAVGHCTPRELIYLTR